MRVESERVEIVRDSIIIGAGEKGGRESVEGERFVRESGGGVVVMVERKESEEKEKEGEKREESA